jgi:hypothetical protein
MTDDPMVPPSSPREELVERLLKDAVEAGTQAGIFSRRNWGTLNERGNVEVAPGLLDCLSVRLEQIAKALREAAAALQSPASEPSRQQEALKALVQDWRNQSVHSEDRWRRVGDQLRQCADELAKVLAIKRTTGWQDQPRLRG